MFVIDVYEQYEKRNRNKVEYKCNHKSYPISNLITGSLRTNILVTECDPMSDYPRCTDYR